MILNDIVTILQYQVYTKTQSSTQICQWKDKANKHLWIIQACIWKKNNAKGLLLSKSLDSFLNWRSTHQTRAAFYFWPYCRCKGAFQKSELVSQTMAGAALWQRNRLFPTVFAEKPSPSCIVFRIWRIWLDSFD